MRTFLRDIMIKGVKNLSEPIEITFAKKDINSFDELSNSNIKAIYGPNGSGKTAVVQAFKILYNVLGKQNYLKDTKEVNELFELLNKATNQIEIALNFFFENKKKDIQIFTYQLKIEFISGEFVITSETYSKREKEYLKNYVLIETKNGHLIESASIKEYADEFKNLLSSSSFLSVLIRKIYKEKTYFNRFYKEHLFLPFIDFLLNTVVLLDNHDLENSLRVDKIKNFVEAGYYSNLIFANKEDFKPNKPYYKKIEIKNFSTYLEDLKQKEQFLQIFKPEITKLDYRKIQQRFYSEDEESFYYIRESIVYPNYEIDLELESTGIKKLLNLYDGFKHLSRGGLLVIDELDSHINDIYLIKLIEYVSLYTRGQLIFTTHNVSPMDLLKTKKNSIDFLSISGKLSSWTQIGNYSPSNAYKTGMIKRLPFNISAEDFLRAFRN